MGLEYMGLELRGQRSRPFTPSQALSAKFYAGEKDESMGAEFRLQVMKGPTRSRPRMSVVVAGCVKTQILVKSVEIYSYFYKNLL